MHILFPKIRQFRDAIRNVHHSANSKVTLDFVGTVKLHGTNAAVVLHPDGKIVAQSRNRVLSLTNDNQGFAAFVFNTTGEEYWRKVFELTKYSGYWKPEPEPIAIYGEWCGGNIQKGVALNQMTKRFVIFAVKVGDKFFTVGDMKCFNVFLPPCPYGMVECIFGYATFSISIDFEDPNKSYDHLVELTSQVEKRCPYAWKEGIDGIGEGIVWRCVTSGYESPDYWFKVKGKAHRGTAKVKTLQKSLTSEDSEHLKTLATQYLTQERLEQGIEYLQELGLSLDKRSTGVYIKWVMNDIADEEQEYRDMGKVQRKFLGSILSRSVKDWFFDYIGD